MISFLLLTPEDALLFVAACSFDDSGDLYK